MRKALSVTVGLTAVLVVTLIASDTGQANSVTFHNHWHGSYVYTKGWGDHNASSWGTGATFWGEAKSYGRNYYFSGDASVIQSQESEVTGYIKCSDSSSWSIKFWPEQRKDWIEVGDPGSFPHTRVLGTKSFPISFNPFDKCNQSDWRVRDTTWFWESYPITFSEGPYTLAYGYIVCVYDPFAYQWACSAAQTT